MAVYLFFDESGNLDFSGKGTKFFALGCLTTINPAAHLCLQAADYCMWAVYRKWTLGDDRSYNLVRRFLKSEVEMFQLPETSSHAP